MRRIISSSCLGYAFTVSIAFLAACSSDDSVGSPATGDAGQHDSATAQDGAIADSATPDANVTLDDSSVPVVAVRCTEADFDAHDHTKNGVDITFPTTAGSKQYTENCARIKVGQTAGFYGDFSMHPLEVAGGDSPSPIPALTNTGMQLKVTPTAAGTFGFECMFHPNVMFGALEVVP